MRVDLIRDIGRVVRERSGRHPAVAAIRPGPEPRVLFLDDRHAPPVATAFLEPAPYGRLRIRLSIDTDARHPTILIPTDMDYRQALNDLNRLPTYVVVGP